MRFYPRPADSRSANSTKSRTTLHSSEDSYREKALTHWAAQNIDLSDPSDWELEEIRSYLTAQAAIYQRKAGYVKAHSERRRQAAWEAKQQTLAEEALADVANAEIVEPENEPEELMLKSHAILLAKDPIQYAVNKVTKLVNKKLVL